MTPVAAIKVESSIIPQNVITCVWQGCDARIEARARPAARDIAYKAGWKSWKSGPKDAKVEHWICPSCAPKRLEALARSEKNRLTVFDGVAAERARKAESEMKEIEAKNQRIESKFERGFRHVLSGSQMAACELLRFAMDNVAKAGNATASYDGISVDTYSFGSKTITDTVIRSRSFERSCQIAVVAAVQMRHHDAWRAFRAAIDQDLGAQELGDWLNRDRRDMMGEKKRREIAISIVELSSAAISALRY